MNPQIDNYYLTKLLNLPHKSLDTLSLRTSGLVIYCTPLHDTPAAFTVPQIFHTSTLLPFSCPVPKGQNPLVFVFTYQDIGQCHVLCEISTLQHDQLWS